MSNVLLLFLALAGMSPEESGMPMPGRQDLVRVEIADPSVVRELDRLGVTINDVGADFCVGEATPAVLARVRALGFKVTVLEENVSGRYYANFFSDSPLGQYLTYAQFRDTMHVIATNNPTLCKLETLGRSANNNLVLALKISDNPAANEVEPVVLWDASTHGDEKIGWAVAFEFIKYLLRNYGTNPTVTALVNDREIWMVPMLNPDGYVASSRYNGHSVDMNRNWGWMWGQEAGPGSSVMSESEISGLARHLWRNPAAVWVSFHAGTEFISYAWSYTDRDSLPVPDAGQIGWLSAGYAARGNSYPYGQGSIGMYLINGSSKDWGYGTLGDMAWSIEVHYTKTPAASQIDPTFARNRDAMLFLSDMAGHGIRGVVTDSLTGRPLHAQVRIGPANWLTYTCPVNGDFYRFYVPGTYSVAVSCAGYATKTFSSVVVPNNADSSVTLNVQLAPGATPLAGFQVVACSCVTVSTNRTYPVRALGRHDSVPYQLDPNKWIVVDMDQPVRNTAGNDFSVFRAWGTGTAAVTASNNWNGPWTAVGTANAARTDLDLAGAGLDSARYLRLKASGTFMFDALEGMGHDVGCVKLMAPAGNVDSGTVITPACSVYNYGGASETYGVRLRIGAGYDQTAQAASHAPGTARLVTFPSWIASPWGAHAVSCSTELATDGAPGNDRRTGAVTIGRWDVGCTRLLAPVGMLDSGASLVPACSVYNYGAQAESYPVRLRIGSGYAESVAVMNHAPGTALGLTFPAWTAVARGLFAVACSTGLAGDGNPGNDRQAGTVLVRVLDAGPTAILAPTGSLDSGAVITPLARVWNLGNTEVGLDIDFAVDDGYAATITRTLAAGAESLFAFPDWTATLRGNRVVRCSTRLAGDMVPGNDLRTGIVSVDVHDAGVIAIASPASAVPPGPLMPQAVLHNYGTSRLDPLVAVFKIDCAPPYSRAVTLGNGLPAGSDTTISFPSWTAVVGSYVARCSLYMPGDQFAVNDTLSRAFAVGNLDAAVMQIVAPVGTHDTGDMIVPQARVRNAGDLPVTFDIVFGIGNACADTLTVAGLAPGETATVTFPEWAKPHAVGSYATRCSVLLAGDANPANNALAGSVVITTRPPLPHGWQARANVPLGAKGRKVKDGGALAWESGSDGKNGSYVYALKGNNTLEFFGYSMTDNTWATLDSVPAIGRAGKKKTVKKGAALACAGGRVYAVKGNNSLEFWRYEPAQAQAPSSSSESRAACAGSLRLGFSWAQLPDVPSGLRLVREGSGMVFVEIGGEPYLYLLKGSATQEFYRYRLSTNSWETRAAAPLGVSGKPFKNGSCVTDDGFGRILAVKGTYNEFYAYDIQSDAWTTLAPVPMIGSVGKKKKVKDGAGLARLGNLVLALKGGNTREFYGYDLVLASWTQLEDMPLGAGRNVKGGGALVAADGVLYALKGNNTPEFYAYNPGGADGSRLTRAQAQTPGASPGLQLRRTLDASGRINFLLARGGWVRLKLYDVTGRPVMMPVDGYRAAGEHSVPLAVRLARGVYVLRLETSDGSLARKLILD